MIDGARDQAHRAAATALPDAATGDVGRIRDLWLASHDPDAAEVSGPVSVASIIPVLNRTHDSVAVQGLDGALLYWSSGSHALYGWSFDEARSLPSPEGHEAPVGTEALIAAGSWQGEVATAAKDGRKLVIDCRRYLLSDSDGRPAAILYTGNDVTLRHQAVDELQRSERQYRNIFQTTGIGIWECDFSAVKRLMDSLHKAGITDLRRHLTDHPDLVRAAIDATICLDVNDASLRIFGATDKAQLLGPVGWTWPGESEAMFRESILAARENKPSFEGEAVLRSVDGRRLGLFLSTAFPPESASRESVYVTVTDISARAEAQAALRIAQADLAHATRLTSLGELAAAIAHEVNQPIAGMLANAQAGLRWLDRTAPDVDAVKHSLQQVVQEAKRAAEVVSGVRALARNDLPQPEPLDLNGLAEETLRLLEYELVRSLISATTRAERSLPLVRADRIQIQQVIINLVLNAVQAMRGREGQRELSIETSHEDGQAIVRVSDTGAGVLPRVRADLFTSFISTRSEGMGLGLSVCASIIKRHGGRIWLAEDDGEGATFCFAIPSDSFSDALKKA